MTEKDKKSEQAAKLVDTRKFPTRYQDVTSTEVMNQVPGFVYRLVVEDFNKAGHPAPEYRGWIPVNHNLGDKETLAGSQSSSDGLVRLKTLLLCKATQEWKDDRSAKLEKYNSSRELSIKQKAIRELEAMRLTAIGGLDTKKSKMVK